MGTIEAKQEILGKGVKMKLIESKGVKGVPRDGIEPPTQGFSVLCSTE